MLNPYARISFRSGGQRFHCDEKKKTDGKIKSSHSDALQKKSFASIAPINQSTNLPIGPRNQSITNIGLKNKSSTSFGPINKSTSFGQRHHTTSIGPKHQYTDSFGQRNKSITSGRQSSQCSKCGGPRTTGPKLLFSYSGPVRQPTTAPNIEFIHSGQKIKNSKGRHFSTLDKDISWCPRCVENDINDDIQNFKLGKFIEYGQIVGKDVEHTRIVCKSLDCGKNHYKGATPKEILLRNQKYANLENRGKDPSTWHPFRLYSSEDDNRTGGFYRKYEDKQNYFRANLDTVKIFKLYKNPEPFEGTQGLETTESKHSYLKCDCGNKYQINRNLQDENKEDRCANFPNLQVICRCPIGSGISPEIGPLDPELRHYTKGL